MHGFDDVDTSDVVAPALIPRALTAGELVFSDGATQAFEVDGGTTYVENGRPTRGEWYFDDGHFGSFWPPSYRASSNLRWTVEDGAGGEFVRHLTVIVQEPTAWTSKN